MSLATSCRQIGSSGLSGGGSPFSAPFFFQMARSASYFSLATWWSFNASSYLRNHSDWSLITGSVVAMNGGDLQTPLSPTTAHQRTQGSCQLDLGEMTRVAPTHMAA